MRIVFTGGGSGGHILPNVAIIDELRSSPRVRSLELFYIGQSGGMEEKIIERLGLKFYGIQAGKLRRYFSFKNIVDAFRVPLGFFQALCALKKIRPHLVFSKGGYVSFPVICAARVLKIPIWLHESDFSPGLSTRLGARFAEKIFLSFEESRQFFKSHKADNVEVVGNPIRAFITQGSREAGLRFTGFSGKRPIVLIIGGSLGAQRLNELVAGALNSLARIADIIHITGSQLTQSASASSSSPSYRAFSFLDCELADCYAAVDLVVSRAGSGSIFEALACAKPMLLIPLPAGASRGDQVENAALFVRRGWARSLDQNSATPEILCETIKKFLSDSEAVAAMINAQKKADVTQASVRIAKLIINHLSGS